MLTPAARRWCALLPVLAVWAVLVVLTLVSVSEGGRQASAAVLAAIAALTALKVALVIFRFMEVGQAPLWLKAACLAWVVLVFAVVGTLVALPQWCVQWLR